MGEVVQAQALKRLRTRTRRNSPGLLTLLAHLEGRALPMAKTLAEELGIPQHKAAKLLHDIRRSGLLRQVGVREPPASTCVSCVYLRVRQDDHRQVTEFEQRLADDPFIRIACLVSGHFDYRLEAWHPDVKAAMLWFRILRAETGVVLDGRILFLHRISSQVRYATAIQAGGGRRDPARRMASDADDNRPRRRPIA